MRRDLWANRGEGSAHWAYLAANWAAWKRTGPSGSADFEKKQLAQTSFKHGNSQSRFLRSAIAPHLLGYRLWCMALCRSEVSHHHHHQQSWSQTRWWNTFICFQTAMFQNILERATTLLWNSKGNMGGIGYEARSRRRSSPDTLAFWACETPRQKFLDLCGVGRTLWANIGEDTAQWAFPANWAT